MSAFSLSVSIENLLSKFYYHTPVGYILSIEPVLNEVKEKQEWIR